MLLICVGSVWFVPPSYDYYDEEEEEEEEEEGRREEVDERTRCRSDLSSKNWAVYD